MSTQSDDVFNVFKSEKLKKLFQSRPDLLESLTTGKDGEYLKALKSKFSDSMIDHIKKSFLSQ